MVLTEPLKFAKDFIDQLSEGLKAENPESKLSLKQRFFLSFCITAIILMSSVCWAEFERASLGRYTLGGLSWMFRVSHIRWDLLLKNSIKVILKKYGITEGVVVVDDSDNPRSKNTTTISQVHCIKDKKTGGYLKGQNIVFILFVSNKITFPIGFGFYEPDPVITAWRKTDKRLKQAGVKKEERPAKPIKNETYPTKQEVAFKLLEGFLRDFPTLKVKCVLADALYGSRDFMSSVSRLFSGIQVISQLRKTQLVRVGNKNIRLKDYFDKRPALSEKLTIRGGKEKNVFMIGARLSVCAHGVKRAVIALRYEDEEEYRYIVATNLCWRMTDIARAYTIRWLVEVFFSDWKLYEGWCQLAKQPGVDGSCRGVILSLLTDHALLTHEDQFALLENNLPASTVGSLRAQLRFDSLCQFIRQLLEAEDPKSQLDECMKQLHKTMKLSPSGKHLNGRDLGQLEPAESLKKRYAA